MTAPAASSLIQRLREARDRGDHTGLSEAIPYARFMGLRSERVGGELLCKLDFSEAIIGNPTLPALHGGAVGALIEWAAVFELLWSSDLVSLPKTINLTIDYMRSARPIDTWAKGTVTRHGRRVVNVRVEAWQDDRAKPIAMGLAHFLVSPDEQSG